VLRGPQGTLYGGSSEGGTVRFITPTPSLTEYSGQVRAEVNTVEGGDQGYDIGAAFGGPIVQDKLGFRLSIDDRRDPGWIDAQSVYDGHTFGTDENYGTSLGLRATLRWQVDETLKITPAYYYGRDYKNEGDNVWGPSPEVKYSGSTVLNGIGGCSTTLKAAANAGPCSLNVGGKTYYYAFAPTQIPGFTQNAMPWYNFQSTGNGYYATTSDPVFIASPRTTTLSVPSITVDKDFGVVQVKGISSVVSSDTRGDTFSGGTGGGGRTVSRYMFGSTDCFDGLNEKRPGFTAGDTTPDTCFTPPGYLPGFPQYQDTYNYRERRLAEIEELRFSNDAGERFNYVAGAYFSHSVEHMDGLEFNNENSISEFYQGVPEAWRIGNYPLPQYGLASPQPYSLDTPLLDVSQRDIILSEREWAIFGEANFSLTEKLKITAGVRYDNYTQIFNQQYGGAVAGDPAAGTSDLNPAGFVPNAAAVQAASRNPNLPNSPTNPITNPANMALFATNIAGCPTAQDCPYEYTSLQDHETTVAPKVGLTYSFTPSDIVYATYSEGFRPGGVNPPAPPLQCAVDFAELNISSTPQTYKQDQVNSYEVGEKFRLLDGHLQLNSSAFYIDWRNMQFNQQLSCGFAFINNAAHATSTGGEVQAASRFGPWTLGANIGYDNAVFASPVTTPTGVLIQRKGDNLGVPDWTATINAEYGFMLMSLPSYFHVDYNYSGTYQRGPGPGTAAYNPYTWEGPAYSTVDMRLGVRIKEIDWSVYVNNVTNAQPFIAYSGGYTPVSDSLRYSGLSIQPRVIGLQGNYRF
jgi:outer membrane receptor protein involved in Fe transport